MAAAATRWGIFGTGNAAFNFVNCLKFLGKEHKVVAVGDRCTKAAAQFSQDHEIPTHGTTEELAANKNVEVAYIAILNPWHLPAAKMMLSAGKHVVCEKPMSLNENEAKELINLARDNKRFLLHAMWSRFFPAYDYVRNVLESGELGEVNMLHIHLGRDMRHVERVQQNHLGGGAILDVGIYAIQLATLVYSDYPEKIVATGYLNKSGCDEAVCATLLYKGNRTANIVLSSTREFPCEAYIAGVDGAVKIEHPFWCPSEVSRGDSSGNLKKIEFPLPKVTFPLRFLNSEGLAYEAMEVRNCLQKGLLESELMPHTESIKIMRIMDEIRRQMGVHYSQESTSNRN